MTAGGRSGGAVRALLGLLMETSLGGSSGSGARGAGQGRPRDPSGAAGVPLPQRLVTDSPSCLIAATVEAWTLVTASGMVPWPMAPVKSVSTC